MTEFTTIPYDILILIVAPLTISAINNIRALNNAHCRIIDALPSLFHFKYTFIVGRHPQYLVSYYRMNAELSWGNDAIIEINIRKGDIGGYRELSFI